MATSLVRCGGRLVKCVLSLNLVQRHSCTLCLPSYQTSSYGIRKARSQLSQSTPNQRSVNYGTAVKEEEELDVLYKGLDIELKGHDPSVLNSYKTFISQAARELDINIYNVSTPPKTIMRTSLLKSVHVYKKHFVQYESRTHYKVIQIKNITGSTADTFLEYIQRNLPEGVMMKVTKCSLQKLPEHIKPPS